MLDPVYCAQLPQEPTPRVAVKALLRLADWMAGQGLLGRQAALHSEGSTHMKGEHTLRENSSALSTPVPLAQATLRDRLPEPTRARVRQLLMRQQSRQAYLQKVSELDVTAEIQARAPGGVPNNVVRTVSENCRKLKFTSQGFEKE